MRENIIYNILIFETGSGADKVAQFINDEEIKNKVNILAYVDNNKIVDLPWYILE